MTIVNEIRKHGYITKKINDKGYYEFYLALSTKLTSYWDSCPFLQILEIPPTLKVISFY